MRTGVHLLSDAKKIANILTLLGPAYLSVSKDPHVFWVWLGFQFFLEMTCLVVIYHIQKES